MKKLIPLLFLLASAASLGAQETTVILVRHAEKTAEPASDPLLSPSGTARADALREAVKGAGITHILTTTLQRTVLTAAPTAAALGIAPSTVNPRSGTHIDDVVAAVRQRAGGVVLVVGHSNTVPAIVNALGGNAPEICDDEYDNMYVVTLAANGGAPRVIRSRYGVATPVGTSCNPMVPVSKQ
jgi:broad specificity phosphatase PhoE